MAPILGSDWVSELPYVDGWNADQGKATTIEAIRTVKQINVVPCSHGGIQLETHRDGFDIEIEIGPDGKIMGVLVARSEERKEGKP